MKKAKYILIFIVLSSFTNIYSQSYDKNFVRERILRIEESSISVAETLSIGEITEFIGYNDGFGRNLQLINTQGSPAMKDIVSFNVYDSYGRSPKKYLPYVDPGTDGSYKSTYLVNQSNFYKGSPKIAHTHQPYSVTVFDESPLQKVMEQGAPGYYWQPGSTNEHTARFEYELNGADEIMVWDIIESSNQCSSNDDYYDPNTLFLKISKDANWDGTNGGYSKVYRDKSGKVILQVARLDANTEAKTYYVYDDFGNLRFIIPPEATKIIEANSTKSTSLTQDLIYWFKYDARQRVIEKKVPGQEVQYFVYDNMDRLILTQDGNLRKDPYDVALKKWQFIKYDIYNRPVISGLYTHTEALDQEDMQSHVDALSSPIFEETITVSAQYPHGYTDQAFPTSSACEILKVIYYDNYSFDANGDYDFDDYTGLLDPTEDQPFYRIRGSLSGMKVKILGSSSDWLYSVFYYDEKGRLIRMIADNHLNNKEFIDNEYFYTGELRKSYLSKTTTINSNTETNVVQYTYDYDNAGRLETISSKINNQAWITMLDHTYNELGQLIEKKVHNISSIDYLQSIDYKYHILGMIKSINTSNLSNNNTVINFDINLQTDEMVYGIKFDTLGMNVVFESPGKGEPDVLHLNFTDSKKLLICDVDDPTTTRELSLNETKTVNIFDGSVADSVFRRLKSLDGNTFTIEYGDIEFDTYESDALVLDSLDKINESKLYQGGMTADTILEATRAQVISYLADRVALIYFNEDNDDLFGMELYYESTTSLPETNPQYNGKISAIQWQCSNYGERQGYSFSYDNLGRFKKANYAEYANTNTWTQNLNRYKVDNITYDLNGNILTLDRRGLVQEDKDQTSPPPFGIMDELSYSYSGNLLTAVNDEITTTPVVNHDFRDNASSGSNEYAYDNNGNMIRDDNKGITAVQYNHLNLPEKVYFDSENYIEYTYDANGTKLAKKVYRVGSLSERKDYSGIFVYNNNEIELILTPEGRAVKQSGGTFDYEYFLKDHLGNVRVIYGKDANGDAYVVQENHYYPFGMTLGGLDYYGSVHNDFLYQGKEFQNDAFDLNKDDVFEKQFLWHDFHARMFDSQIGRWHAPDPILNEASPYIGMGNDPINLIDPDGKQWKRRLAGWHYQVAEVNGEQIGDPIRTDPYFEWVFEPDFDFNSFWNPQTYNPMHGGSGGNGSIANLSNGQSSTSGSNWGNGFGNFGTDSKLGMTRSEYLKLVAFENAKRHAKRITENIKDINSETDQSIFNPNATINDYYRSELERYNFWEREYINAGIKLVIGDSEDQFRDLMEGPLTIFAGMNPIMAVANGVIMISSGQDFTGRQLSVSGSYFWGIANIGFGLFGLSGWSGVIPAGVEVGVGTGIIIGSEMSIDDEKKP